MTLPIPTVVIFLIKGERWRALRHATLKQGGDYGNLARNKYASARAQCKSSPPRSSDVAATWVALSIDIALGLCLTLPALKMAKPPQIRWISVADSDSRRDRNMGSKF